MPNSWLELDRANLLHNVAALRALVHRVTARPWIKVDTGLGRLGVPYRLAPEFIRDVHKRPGIQVAGLFSTLAETHERNRTQVARLREVSAEVRDLGHLPLSIASTQGVLSMPDSRLDIVRPGMALLGVAPHAQRLDPAIVQRLELRPIVTWKARVAYVKLVPLGECVGYGPRPMLERDTPVATLAVGWADVLATIPRTVPRLWAGAA